MFTGTIVEISRRGVMFIVHVDGGDFAVFELLDSIALEVGQQVRGDLDALGSEDFFHLEEQTMFQVYGQTGPSSLAICRELIASY